MQKRDAALFLNEVNSADMVTRRLLAGGDGHLPRFLSSIVRHLHAAVRESEPTPADWRAAIGFLTEVGHVSDDKRQEWVLLSDLLGVTALVEEMSTRRPRGATPNTPRGPFYRQHAPRYAAGQSISLDRRGEPLVVSGTVRDLDGKPIAGAIVETWQANADGLYENQQPDAQPDHNLRGIFDTDEAGRFHFLSVKPGGYSVPADGPVGKLLGGLGYPLTRPAHIGFIIRAEGFDTVVTQVYDRADPHLHLDAVLGVRPELVADFRAASDKSAPQAWSLHYDFVLVRAKTGRRAA